MSVIDRLDRLSAAQEARLPAIRDKWIAAGLSTEPADRRRAEAGVRLAYRSARLPAPSEFVWADSPMGGVLAAEAIHGGDSRLRTAAADDVRSRVTAGVTAQVAEVTAAIVSKQVRDDVMSYVAAQVAAQVWGPVRHQIEAQIGGAVEGAGYGQHDAHWIAFYDALRECGIDVSALDGLTEIAASAGWWWPFYGVCVLTERPLRLVRDVRGRLHCGDGPAVAYPDGWCVYAWHGVVVEARVIINPASITLDDVQCASSHEVRRVLLDRYGLERYVRTSGAIPVHADETGTLYRCEQPGDEPLVVVSVTNATPGPDGAKKNYMLRVPPDITEARQAVAWTFEQDAADYKPAVET